MGTIDLIMGCMFSGKTTEIFKRLDLISKNQCMMYINSDIDTRTINVCSTHNPDLQIPENIKMVKTNKLYDIITDALKCDVIAIDECQFFPDLKFFCIEMAEIYNKKIIVAGLNGDFKRQLFGQMYELIPYCDTIFKLNALCKLCLSPAIFSMRYNYVNDNVILVGGENMYIPVCRNCFLKKHLM